MTGLGSVLENLGSFSGATGVNFDGSVVVGTAVEGQVHNVNQAFRWTAASGMVGLGFGPAGASTSAAGVNGDGSVIVGCIDTFSTCTQAFRWTAASGYAGLGFLTGSTGSSASAVNADGSVVVGTSQSQTFRWTAATGMIGLGNWPGQNFSGASGVSADGSVVIGGSNRWTSGAGWQSVQTALIASGVNLTGWILQSITGVSADGTVMVGAGTNPSGNQQAWIAHLPLPVSSLRLTPAPNIAASGNPGGSFFPSSFDYSLSSIFGSVRFFNFWHSDVAHRFRYIRYGDNFADHRDIHAQRER